MANHSHSPSAAGISPGTEAWGFKRNLVSVKNQIKLPLPLEMYR